MDGLLEYLEEIKNENENNELVIEKEINDEGRKKKDKKNKNKNNDNSKEELIIVSKNKKYIQPPVVSHPSQLPTMAYEEIDSGKLFTSPNRFLMEIETKLKNEELIQKGEKQAEVETDNTKTKQYIQPPVVSHDSQLPSIAFEEINNGKLFASLHNISAVGIEKSKEEEVKETSKELMKENVLKEEITIIESEEKKAGEETENIKENKKLRNKNKQRKNENKEREEIEVSKETKTKQYIQPPVVSHNSQLPSIACEEINNGKLFASLHNISATGIEKPKEEESKDEEVKETKLGNSWFSPKCL